MNIKFLVLMLFLTFFSIILSSTSVFAWPNTTVIGNVTFVSVNITTYIGNVSTPPVFGLYGEFAANLTFTANEANCFDAVMNSSNFSYPPRADFTVELNQSNCTYTVELIINDAVIKVGANETYNSSVTISGFNVTEPNSTLNFQLIPSTEYNFANSTGGYRIVSAFAIDYDTTNSSATSANFTYARRGVVPDYVYVCDDWNFGNLYNTSTEVPYNCSAVNATTNLLSSSVINGTWISVNLTDYIDNGILLGESMPNSKPIVKTEYGVTDCLTNVSILKWGARKSEYYAIVPIMQFNVTSNRPYIASSGFIDAMYFDKPVFENPDVMELLALNLTVNLTFNGTAGDKTNITYGARYDSINFKNESNLIPAWYVTHEEIFMGETINRTILSPSLSPTGAAIYYIYNNTVCGPYDNQSASGQEGSYYYDNSTSLNANCSRLVLYNYGQSSVGLIDLPITVEAAGAGSATLTSLFSLAPPSFEGQTGASLSSPIFLTNQTLTGGFIPGPEASPPQPGTATNIEMVVSVNNSLTDFNITDSKLYVRFLYPINVTGYNSTEDIVFQATMGSNFTLYNKTGNDWVKVANETWSEAGIVDTFSNCTNMTDNLPGPNIGNNITLCFHQFDFNLSAVNGWSPNNSLSNITLNMTASLNVSIMSETTVPSGSIGTSRYNATISTPSAGSIDLYDKVPNINATDATITSFCIDGNCSSDRYNTGSFEVVFDSSGTHSVTIVYTRAAATTTTTTTSPSIYLPTTTTTAAPTTTTTTIPAEETTTVDIVAAGETAEFEFETAELRIESVAIVANKALANIAVTVKESSLPSEASAPIASDVGAVYKYLELEKSEFTDDDITTATIKFKVEKTWIISNDIDEDKVYLYRYSDAAWENLTTTKVSSDANYVHYEAESTGLSVFAIGGEKLPSTTTTTLPAGLPFEIGALEIIAIIIVVALIIIFVLYKKGIINF